MSGRMTVQARRARQKNCAERSTAPPAYRPEPWTGYWIELFVLWPELTIRRLRRCAGLAQKD